MKRYTLKTKETVDVHEMGMKTEIRRTHAIARLEKALGLVSQGRCPECGQKTAGWKCPSGGFAPEMAATLREDGIDIGTGHKVTCSRGNQRH